MPRRLIFIIIRYYLNIYFNTYNIYKTFIRFILYIILCLFTQFISFIYFYTFMLIKLLYCKTYKRNILLMEIYIKCRDKY